VAEDQAHDQEPISRMLLRVLLTKVARDPYPSATMMDTVEELLTPDTAQIYVRLLLARIEEDEFPSLDMIDRVRNLV